MSTILDFIQNNSYVSYLLLLVISALEFLKYVLVPITIASSKYNKDKARNWALQVII